MIKGRVTKPEAAIKHINGLKNDSLKAVRLAVVDATLSIHRDAVLIVSKNEGGKPAVRRGKNVTVSDPFEAPHTDTGRLRQSVKMQFGSNGETGFVGSNLKYAAYLEFGTEDMAPRPWLSTAVDQNKDKIANIFVEFMEKELKK